MAKLVLIDPRWGQGEASAQLRQECVEEFQNEGYKAILKQMTTADVVFTVPQGRVGIEMKNVRDLLDSHREGRLDNELYRLAREFAVPVLCITEHLGSEADIPESGGWSFPAVDNMLFGRQVRGVHVIHCGTMSIAHRIIRFEQYLGRMKDKQIVRPKKRHFPAMGKLTVRAEIVYALLSGIKGIKGKAEIAEALASQMSLQDIFGLDKDGWREKGFSPLMAGRLSVLVQETE